MAATAAQAKMIAALIRRKMAGAGTTTMIAPAIAIVQRTSVLH